MPTFTISNAREFLALLRSNPEWKEEVRREILAEELLRLPAKVDHLEAKMEQGFREVRGDIDGLKGNVDGLKADVAGLKTDVAGLKTDVAGLKTDVDGLKTDVAGLKTDVDGLKGDVGEVKSGLNRLSGQVGNLSGEMFEQKYNVTARINRYLRRASVVDVFSLDRLDDADQLTDAERTQLESLDRFLAGRKPGAGTDAYAAVELSLVVDAKDVRRAAERAAIIRRFEYDVLAAAAGQRATRGAFEEADRLGVVLILEQPAIPQ